MMTAAFQLVTLSAMFSATSMAFRLPWGPYILPRGGPGRENFKTHFQPLANKISSCCQKGFFSREHHDNFGVKHVELFCKPEQFCCGGLEPVYINGIGKFCGRDLSLTGRVEDIDIPELFRLLSDNWPKSIRMQELNTEGEYPE
ncbi:DgyrCDS4200 [Dimorphilus gyrociliatus]|uniref:DgyrCDS4200 n=1 Tax=Dimorphilus gyrociliatus TaxID=2664684 RepID=A0A7I8VFY7_9ANNE|nr:DgyrCDS4200 [Dimorphilus gyrociliatus]